MIIQSLVQELSRAVFTIQALEQQQMMGGMNPLGGAVPGLGGDPLTDLSSALGSPDAFSTQDACGAGVPQLLPSAGPGGSMPSILGPGGGLDPTSQSALSTLGSNYNDPLALMQGFDPGRYLAQNLFNALPQAGSVPTSSPCGCSGESGALPFSPLMPPSIFPGAAPGIFDALNVHQDLRTQSQGCGAKGCCHWEPHIA
jgi:hypothetical protein